MRQGLIRTFLFGFMLCATAVTAEAASLYIDPASSELNRGDAVELSVRLDVDEAARECVNAIDAVISYTDNIAPVDVSVGDSIFSIWVEEPTINKEEQTISFAGGMPNGYCGRIAGDPRLTNNLVKLIFRLPGFTVGAPSEAGNTARVSFTEFTTAYLNDGLGTKVTPKTYGATMQLSSTAGSGIVDPWREAVGLDQIPPEEFSIILNKDEEGLDFSGKYYISFNTTDKQTGIDQYQVMEEPIEQFGAFNWGRADAPWIIARSPYILEDQSLNSVIRVRAIDKAGNEYIATLLPDESARKYSTAQLMNFIIFVVIGLIVIGCLAVITRFILERIRRKPEDVEGDQDESAPEDGLEEEENNYEENESH